MKTKFQLRHKRLVAAPKLASHTNPDRLEYLLRVLSEGGCIVAQLRGVLSVTINRWELHTHTGGPRGPYYTNVHTIVPPCSALRSPRARRNAEVMTAHATLVLARDRNETLGRS